MKASHLRPALVRTLGRLPVVRSAILAAHDSWLQYAYRRRWDWANAAARMAWQQGTAQRCPVESRVLRDLSDGGIAQVSFAELLGDTGHCRQLGSAMQEWLGSKSVRDAETSYRNGGYRSATFKEYQAARYEGDAAISWECPWLQLGIHSRLLEIASAYLGMMARLHHVNLWNTIALKHDGPDIGPQRWHRDPDDIRLLKVFLYFTDVDAGSGPLEYVPNSRPGEAYGHLWPARIPIDGARPPRAKFDAAIPQEKRVTCCVPRGTFVFADTAGFHRGGRATTSNRVLATWAYSSQASLWPRKFRLTTPPPCPLSLAAQWALFGEAERLTT